MFRTSVLCVAFTCLAITVASGQQSTSDEKTLDPTKAVEVAVDEAIEPKFAPPAEAKAAEMRDAIIQEIGTLGEHPWAGEYYFGDGLGVNASLAIAPQSGCVFEWHGCMGLYDRNYGQVTEKDGRIVLKLKFPNEQVGFQGVAEELIPIQWGKRHYLIPANDVVGFCNDVNDGTEPRQRMHGRYSLRCGDEDLEIEGQPAVPKAYAAYLLEKPIEAEVIAVGHSTNRPSLANWDFHDTPITLRPGKNAGLLVGMEMRVVQPDSAYGSLTITEVHEETCEAIVTQLFGEETRPQEGWKFSTRRVPVEEIKDKPKPKKRTQSPRKARQAAP